MQNKNNTIYKGILTISGLIIIFAGLKTADKIIVPFFLSMFIALISFPLLKFFQSNLQIIHQLDEFQVLVYTINYMVKLSLLN